MDPVLTVKVCDQWFEGDYLSLAKELKSEKDLLFNFLETIISANEDSILKEYNQAIMPILTQGISTTG